MNAGAYVMGLVSDGGKYKGCDQTVEDLLVEAPQPTGNQIVAYSKTHGIYCAQARPCGCCPRYWLALWNGNVEFAVSHLLPANAMNVRKKFGAGTTWR